jgi:transcriptional regulator with GAF, ATPase, and Fis domain
VRIVAATNRNLEEEVKRRALPQDLYYRLQVFPVRIPALRERREDIPCSRRTSSSATRRSSASPSRASRSRRWSC